jgi:hypothetical protein
LVVSEQHESVEYRILKISKNNNTAEETGEDATTSQTIVTWNGVSEKKFSSKGFMQERFLESIKRGEIKIKK